MKIYRIFLPIRHVQDTVLVAGWGLFGQLARDISGQAGDS